MEDKDIAGFTPSQFISSANIDNAYDELIAEYQALTDEVKHLKESIQVIGFMLAQEKAEVARLRERLRINVKFMGSAARLARKSGCRVVAIMLELEIEQSSQLLNSKGPVDNETVKESKPSH